MRKVKKAMNDGHVGHGVLRRASSDVRERTSSRGAQAVCLGRLALEQVERPTNFVEIFTTDATSSTRPPSPMRRWRRAMMFACSSIGGRIFLVWPYRAYIAL